MDINILTGIAAIIAAVASLIFTLQRWHHHFSRQARERSKFHMHRRALAEKFVRQLRQAEFYSELEEEFCRRLSTHVEAAPNTIKTQVRKSVSDKFGNGAKANSRICKPAGIENQLNDVREMGFGIQGEQIWEVSMSRPRHFETETV